MEDPNFIVSIFMGNSIGLNIELFTGLDNKIFEGKVVNIFLLISFNICFGCLKEPSH